MVSLPPRSSGTTRRSWLNPAGCASKMVMLANILVMRMLYMRLGCKWDPEDTANNSGISWTCFLNTETLRGTPTRDKIYCRTASDKCGAPSILSRVTKLGFGGLHNEMPRLCLSGNPFKISWPLLAPGLVTRYGCVPSLFTYGYGSK